MTVSLSDRPRQARADKRLLPIDAVAEQLAVSSKTVRRLIASGALVAHRVGRSVRVSEHDLHAFLSQRRC